MSADTTALADLARDIGAALIGFSEAIRPPTGGDAQSTDAIGELGLGKRQHEIAELLAASHVEEGIRANEVSAAIGYDAANTHTALKALVGRGVVEEIAAGGEPTRWRLTEHYRGTSDPYIRMAGFVRFGEWTTYGDISIAVRGDMSAARAVGRAAATQPQFPHAHRVLWKGGRIPPTWKSSAAASPDPEECLHRLEAEGVRFDSQRRAKREGHYVSWDVLVERSDEEG